MQFPDGAEFKADADVLLDTNIPIVVLVNDQSASASEIMAGCLQDLGRAKIAGQRSYGKGTVQQVFPLDNDQTALKFTTARFYRPSGKNIHRGQDMGPEDEWGITPDAGLELPLSELQMLYLNRRWRQRGDPRIVAAVERPPAPECAGDPQLRVVLSYLQDILDQ
jgi:carboxyl-terminal processing protease